MIIADTSGLLAFFNEAEPSHEAVADVVASAREPLVVSPFVLAELDYLVATRLGVDAEQAVLHELGSGAYELATIDHRDVRDSTRIIGRYADQEIGLTDASLVVLAQRYGTRSLLTLDHRHFDVVRPLDGGRFRLLPGR